MMLPGLDRPDDAPGRTQSLYRKYRPTTFDSAELVGQEHIARTLRNAIARNRVAHAYLFCGPRGTGKTSTARLLAKAVNCLDPDPAARPCNLCTACIAINEGRTTDIIEIDAASNRGIDDMRELRERVKYAPTQLRTKFYIIDEAHQITRDAFNAFLKTLEEPPPNTTFVLATTDPDRLPDTIASRCQRFDFRRIPADAAMDHLRTVADREGIPIDDDAIAIIARQATGSLRDALSLLDLLATSAGQFGDGVVDAELARRMLGLSQDGRAIELVRAIASADVPAGLAVIGAAVDAGQDIRSFGRHISSLLRTLMLIKAGAQPAEMTPELEELGAAFTLPALLDVNRLFSDVDFAVRNGGIPQLPIELAFLGAVLGPTASQAAPPATMSQSGPIRNDPPPTPVHRTVPPAAAPDPPPRRREPQPRTADARPAASGEQATRAPAGSASVAQIAAQWERIRTEVRAVDRKAEALLASTDPFAFDGTVLTIVATYPFHVGRLNDPRMRQIVEAAVAHVVGVSVQVEVVLKSESEPAPVTRVNGTARPAAVTEPPIDYSPEGPEEEHHVAEPTSESIENPLVRGAKAIFNAREIE